MIERGLDRAWPTEVAEAIKPFLQGHLVERPPLFFAADLRHPVWRTTRLAADEVPPGERGEEIVDLHSDQRPPFGIITTQSCDLAEERPEPRQPWLSVAPVYELGSSDVLLDRDYIYRLGRPAADGKTWAADLRIEMPLEKSVLVNRNPEEAFRDESEYIAFSRFLARRRGRPALASIVHEVLSDTTRRLKEESPKQKRLARNARSGIYKLKLAIEDGTRLSPVAIKLYVVTNTEADADVRHWFDLWWQAARLVAADRGLQLHPTGWMEASSVDARLYDDLIEMRNPV